MTGSSTSCVRVTNKKKVADKVHIEQRAEGSYFLCGEVTFVTVPMLLRQGEDMFASAGEVVLDLQEVTRSDSAGLALLVEWTRRARQHDVNLSFKNVAEQMLAMATFSGLSDILPLR